MTHTCPVCGSLGEVQTETGHYICSNCSLWFSDPMAQADSEWYQNCPAYSPRNNRGVIISTVAGLYHKIFTSQVPESFWIVESETDFEHRGRCAILDIGCGDGAFLKRMSRKGYLTAGVDHDPRVAEKIADESIVIKNRDITEYLDTTNELYPVVTMFEVLEHMEDPVGIMEKVRNIVASGGSVYISVPNYSRSPKLFDPLVDHSPHHITLWSQNSLTTLAHKSGFRPVGYYPIHFQFNDLVTHLKWRTMGVLRGTPGYTMKGILEVVGNILTWPSSQYTYGPASIMVKFRKV